MSAPQECHHDVALAYEALRAQATGELPAVGLRGLAVVLAAGVPAWMQILTPLAPTAPTIAAAPSDRSVPVGLGGEVVQLLAEMALSCQRRWTT